MTINSLNLDKLNHFFNNVNYFNYEKIRKNIFSSVFFCFLLFIANSCKPELEYQSIKTDRTESDLKNLTHQISNDPNFQEFQEKFVDFVVEFKKQIPHDLSISSRNALYDKLQITRDYNELKGMLSENGFSKPDLVAGVLRTAMNHLYLLAKSYDLSDLTIQQKQSVIQGAFNLKLPSNYSMDAMGALDNDYGNCCANLKDALKVCVYVDILWVINAWSYFIFTGNYWQIGGVFHQLRQSDACIDQCYQNWGWCCQ